MKLLTYLMLEKSKKKKTNLNKKRKKAITAINLRNNKLDLEEETNLKLCFFAPRQQLQNEEDNATTKIYWC